MTIKARLVVASLLVVLLSLLAAHLVVHFQSTGAVTAGVLDHIESVAVIQRHRVEGIIDRNLERLALVASKTQLRLSLEAFLVHLQSAGAVTAEVLDHVSDPADLHRDMMNRILHDTQASIAGFKDIYVATLDGTVAASTDAAAVGADLSKDEAFLGGKAGSRADLLSLNRDGGLEVHLAGPLYRDQRLLGVVIVRAAADEIVALTGDYSGLGETGETLLAAKDRNGDALFLTPLRFDPAAALRRTVAAGRQDTPIMRALTRNVGLFSDTVDYRGEPVLAATQFVEGPGWGIVVKMDKSEALAPVRRLRASMAAVLALSAAAVLIVALWLARSITGPVSELRRMAGRIGEGDLSGRSQTARADELGGLAGDLDEMARKLELSHSALTGEIDQRKRAEVKPAHLNAVLRAVRDVNQLITRESDRDALLAKICRSLVETRGYRVAWIALFDEKRGLAAAAEAGLGETFGPLRERLARGEPPGCIARALEQPGVVVIRDAAAACSGCPAVATCADATVLAVRLAHGERGHGALVVALPEGYVEDPEELSLLREVAGDIAFALRALGTGEALRDVQDAHRESEERYRDLVENMNNLFQSVAPDGTFVYVNRAWRRTLGYAEEEVRGLTLWDVVHPDEEAHCRGILDRVMSGEQVERIETRFVTKDGRVVEVEGSANCRMAGGRLVASREIYRDVTPRKLAERARREAEEKLRSLIESADDIIMMVGRDGAIQFINRTVPGFAAEKVVGTTVYEYTAPEYHARIRQCLEHVFETGEAGSYETAGMGPDGSMNWYATRVAPIRRDGRVVSTTHICRDITGQRLAETALRKTEEQFIQSQKLEAIGRLAGGVAHDFNNMLGAIIGYGDIALEGLKAADPLRGDIEHIKDAANRAAALTHQLLAFSRKQALQPKVMDLNAAVAGLERMLRRLIGEDIELTTKLARGLGCVRADPSQIDQIVMNLAVNSRDAMPKGGRLTIETADVELDEEYAEKHVAVTPGHHVMLAVSDTGCGMDEDTRSRIFEPFFTTKEKGKGTGLGLSTVYGIVKQSGGNIWVYSEPGRGATFKIYFPRVEGAAEPAAAPRPSARAEAKGGETVLVVEDEDMLRELVKRILTLLGYTTLEARNGGEALLLCEQRRETIHLLITDVIMPQMGGRELAERVRPIHPEMKVLYMSGYTDNAIVHHGVLDPGTPFVEKPFTASILARKVRETLDSSAATATPDPSAPAGEAQADGRQADKG